VKSLRSKPQNMKGKNMEDVKKKTVETNRKYSLRESFLLACKSAQTKVTIRQASKLRRGKGIAFKVLMGKMKPLTSSMPGYQYYEMEGL